jgi:hypothetical protein
MLTKVTTYVRQRRNKLLYEFVRLFFSRQWFVLSVIAATLVIVATLIQTYVNVIGSNGMQPHFPHLHRRPISSYIMPVGKVKL